MIESKNANKYFGAFIITYKRPLILVKTIKAVLAQTLPPSVVLVIDNANSQETKESVLSLADERVVYHAMAINVGPAGGAAFGLRKLAEEGFEWVFWGDDDDPPYFDYTFEKLLSVPHVLDGRPVGIVGSVGQMFSRVSGNLVRISDDELRRREFPSVHFIGGGQCLIARGEIALQGILPDNQMFFGFEDLDFTLKVLRAGYTIRCSSSLQLKLRDVYGKINYQKPNYLPRTFSALNRQYYSVRNLLKILISNGLYIAFAYQLIKNLFKVVFGFRFGFGYGKKSGFYILSGIVDFFLKRDGRFKFCE